METAHFNLSPEDVARQIGVVRQTVSRWAADGDLPCITTPGGHRRFRQEDVDRFIAGLSSTGAPS